MDTCDRCGAHVRAYWKATDQQGHELDLCAHHAGRLRPALIAAGWLLAMLPSKATVDA